MVKIYNNSEDAIELLRALLDADLAERASIERDLHGEKSDLAMINILLSVIEQDALKGNFNPETIKQPAAVLSEKLDGLRNVSRQIFPKVVYWMGLISGLTKLTENTGDLGVKFKFSSSVTERLKTDPMKEVSGYLICLNIIEYFALSGETEVFLDAKLDKDKLFLEFKVAGYKIENESPYIQKLNLVKARLIWQKITVLPGTDWKTSIKLAFNLS